MIGHSLSSECIPIKFHSPIHSACQPPPKATLPSPRSSTRQRSPTRHSNQLNRLHAAFGPSNRRLQSHLDRFSSTSAAMARHEEQPSLGEESSLPKSTAEELNDESEFEKIVSSEGYISICGFASLLSERSARSTFPDLINFRLARLRGFRRVFAHAAPIFFERGIAKPETKEISSLSVEPCDGETLIVTVFEIQKSEIPSFIKREVEFRFLAVFPETLDGQSHTNPAVTRTSSISCMDNITYIRFGGMTFFHVEPIFVTAKNLGEEALNNFIDHTFLGDRKTTIREYLATAGSGIMDEEPPEPLKTRYGDM
ncbi:hypothetical protein V2J09_005633 [Rumex salicifolius]